jgi:hypothetical protein
LRFGGFLLTPLLVQLLFELAALLAAESALELQTLLALVAQQEVLQTLWILIQIHLDAATSQHPYKSTVWLDRDCSPATASSDVRVWGMPVNITS